MQKETEAMTHMGNSANFDCTSSANEKNAPTATNKPSAGNRLEAYGNAGHLDEKNTDAKYVKLMDKITPDDLIKYGLIPELVGRLPILSVLKPLDEEELKRVLLEPKNALVKQYKAQLKLEKVDLEISDSAYTYILKKAKELNMGARGLRSVMEKNHARHFLSSPRNEKQESCA